MSILQTVVVCLGAAVSFSLAWLEKDNEVSVLGVARVYISEALTPRLDYSKFESLTATGETARNSIESMDLVNTNYVGKYLSVKLHNDSNVYHVYTPQNCSDSPIKRLESVGISVGYYFSCL